MYSPLVIRVHKSLKGKGWLESVDLLAIFRSLFSAGISGTSSGVVCTAMILETSRSDKLQNDSTLHYTIDFYQY